MSAPPRRIELEGCRNFRDLGGYLAADGRVVRRGQLYRSDALHLVTPADIARLTGELGIGTIVDLRSTGEVEREGRGPLEALPLRFHHLPLIDGFELKSTAKLSGPIKLSDRYFLLAEVAKAPIARVLAALAESDAPAVYHCAAGKDRTGVLSAVILGLLGVPDDVIVADYALTAESLDAINQRLLASEGYQAILASLPPDTMHAEPETMVALLDKVRERYGGIAGYAEAAGVSDETVARLAEQMLVTA